MIDLAQRLLVRLLKVPPRPPAPAGAPESERVFQAAPGFLRYQLLRWGFGQAAAAWFLFVGVLGIGFFPFPEFPAPVFPSVFPFEPFASLDDLAWIEVLAVGAFLLQVPATFLGVFLDYRLRWYIVTDRSLRIREGIVRVREKTMSFANIQNLSEEQGPVQRLFGISDLQVRTAGGGESKGKEGKEKGDSMHEAYFRGVDNGGEIRDLILGRLRRFRDAGLGDVAHREEGAVAVPAAPVSPGPAAPDPAAELLAAARALVDEARRLGAVAPGDRR